MPKAKLIKYTPSEVSRYFDRYEYECIECGEHYFRCTSNARINPYCANCCRKHDRIKARERNKKRDESIYQQGFDDGISKAIRILKAEFKMQNNPNSKFVPSIVLKEDFITILEDLTIHNNCE